MTNDTTRPRGPDNTPDDNESLRLMREARAAGVQITPPHARSIQELGTKPTEPAPRLGSGKPAA